MKYAVLIGGARAQKLPSLVCEHSIRSRTKLDIKFVHGYEMDPIEPGKPENRSRTGFSFQRFLLSRIAGEEGVGIYLDSDMIVLVDIKDMPSLGFSLTCTKNMPAVITTSGLCNEFDVKEILRLLDNEAYSYKSLMNLDPFHPWRIIPEDWNCLDVVPDGAKIVHYTDMSKQCWRVEDKRPVSDLWRRELKAAVDSGFISRATVEQETLKGFVIRDVMSWI